MTNIIRATGTSSNVFMGATLYLTLYCVFMASNKLRSRVAPSNKLRSRVAPSKLLQIFEDGVVAAFNPIAVCYGYGL